MTSSNSDTCSSVSFVGAVRQLSNGVAAVADGIFLARDLVNEPPNVLTPDDLARRATEGGSYHVQASLCQTAGWIVDEKPRCARFVSLGFTHGAALLG